jgi:hypothetical protein
MNDKILNFTMRVGGVLTDATSVKLSDPTGTFGVRRQDTGDIIVADGTDYSHDGTGVYSYTIDGDLLVAGKVYEYWRERVYNGVTARVERTFTAGLAEATGWYTNQTLMRNYAGRKNLDEYADVEGNKSDDDIIAGIQSGIDMAASFTNRLARAAGHTNVPLPTSSKDFEYVRSLNTKLAIAETYFKRGRRDNLDETSPQFGTYGVMSGMYKQARKDLEAFFEGVVDGSGGPEQSEPGGFEQVPIRFGDNCG